MLTRRTLLSALTGLPLLKLEGRQGRPPELVLREPGETTLDAILRAYPDDYYIVRSPKFRRYLSCQCHTEWTLRFVMERPEFRFRWTGLEFMAVCPTCGYDGVFGVVDRQKGIDEVRWVPILPREIEERVDELTGTTMHRIWTLPEWLLAGIKTGSVQVLLSTPYSLIVTARNESKFLFYPDRCHTVAEWKTAADRS
jgi:hypothetical protein